MTLRDMVVSRMQMLDVRPKKSLGQNFLISERVVSEIFQYVDRLKPATIIEVGPGLGVLTERILEKKYPHLLIEMDRKFSQYWRERGANVAECDALEWPWDQWPGPEHTMLLSNLPYQIGSRLLVEVSASSRHVDQMILMFQKEVAERIRARPREKEYGFLSVIAQSYWRAEVLTQAGRQDFLPPPNVDSTVLHLTRKDSIPQATSYIAFVKAAFQNRRKFMLKSFPQQKNQLVSVLEEMGYDQKVRAEEISVADFQRLFVAFNSESIVQVE